MQTTTQSSLTPEQIASLAEFDREAEEAAKIIKEYRDSQNFVVFILVSMSLKK